jgi:hypothetical protein
MIGPAMATMVMIERRVIGENGRFWVTESEANPVEGRGKGRWGFRVKCRQRMVSGMINSLHLEEKAVRHAA